jgi:hypothetical protein
MSCNPDMSITEAENLLIHIPLTASTRRTWSGCGPTPLRSQTSLCPSLGSLYSFHIYGIIVEKRTHLGLEILRTSTLLLQHLGISPTPKVPCLVAFEVHSVRLHMASHVTNGRLQLGVFYVASNTQQTLININAEHSYIAPYNRFHHRH